MDWQMRYRTGEKRTRGVYSHLIAVLLITGLLFSCSSGSGNGSTTQTTATVAGELVAWTAAGALDAASVNIAIATLGLTGVTASSGATCYKLTYGTPDVSVVIINASGLVCLPAARSGGNPVISYQHGTIFQDRDAPSSFLTSADAAIGAVLAGLGYIVVMPDYIGYGDSTAVLHPYLHESTLSSATVNMNRATRKFLALPNINMATNGQFFLTGYSEGGYATLATQRLMQSLPAEFQVTASEPGAGPYDMTGTTLAILSSPTLSQPAFTGFFLKAYDSIYNTPSQITRYFSASFAGVVNTHFDGSFTRAQITADLGGGGVSTAALFKSTFLTSYLSVSGEAALKADIAENDIYDWAPTAPTRLFHGVDDDTVPYANTTTTQARMTANGSTTVTVVDCTAAQANHANCARPFAADMIVFFRSLTTGL